MESESDSMPTHHPTPKAKRTALLLKRKAIQRFRGQLLSNSGFLPTYAEIVKSRIQNWDPIFPNISVATILERRLTDSASAHYGGLSTERRRQGN